MLISKYIYTIIIFFLVLEIYLPLCNMIKEKIVVKFKPR